MKAFEEVKMVANRKNRPNFISSNDFNSVSKLLLDRIKIINEHRSSNNSNYINQFGSENSIYSITIEHIQFCDILRSYILNRYSYF